MTNQPLHLRLTYQVLYAGMGGQGRASVGQEAECTAHRVPACLTSQQGAAGYQKAQC